MLTRSRACRDEVEMYQSQEQTLIKKYLNIIADAISQNGGVIHFGNTNLILDTNADGVIVPFECSNWLHYNTLSDTQKKRAVELYSPDGWTSLYDIANWADIVTDYLNTKKEGVEQMKAKGYLPK